MTCLLSRNMIIKWFSCNFFFIFLKHNWHKLMRKADQTWWSLYSSITKIHQGIFQKKYWAKKGQNFSSQSLFSSFLVIQDFEARAYALWKMKILCWAMSESEWCGWMYITLCVIKTVWKWKKTFYPLKMKRPS